MLADGGGGKGTWGKLLDTGGESHIDRNDPNYDSGEVIFFLILIHSSCSWFYMDFMNDKCIKMIL